MITIYDFIFKTTQLIVELGSYLASQWLLFVLRGPWLYLESENNIAK